MEFPELQYILAKLEFVSIEYDPIFCTMEKETEGVIKCSFEVGVGEQGSFMIFTLQGMFFIISSYLRV